jgi:alpha,alpha-trehalose phosphorylase
MRDHDGAITFAPRLPPRLNRMVFRMSVRDCCIEVQVRSGEASYQLLYGEPMELRHHGEAFTVRTHETKFPIPPLPLREAPKQPRGREPYRRQQHS